VFCILLRVLSRLLEEPSLATTFKGVYFILCLFYCRYMFQPLLAIFSWNTQQGQQGPKHVEAKICKIKNKHI
jgi:hypothetical protein